MENGIKVRLRHKSKKNEPEHQWRYGLTVSDDGCIMSSTTNPKRAAIFSDEIANRVIANKARFHKLSEVESF